MIKTKILGAIVILLIVPSMALAAWWNPFSWLGERPNQLATIKTAVTLSAPGIAPVLQKKQTITADPTTDIQSIITDTCNQIIQEYLPKEELDSIKEVAQHTMASVDPDKTGIQRIYIPGSVIAGDGTYFSANNLSSNTLTTTTIIANGMTLQDTATQDPYCVTSNNGSLLLTAGECSN